MCVCVCVCAFYVCLCQLLVLNIQPCCSCSFILCYTMFHCNTEIAERINDDDDFSSFTPASESEILTFCLTVLTSNLILILSPLGFSRNVHLFSSPQSLTSSTSLSTLVSFSPFSSPQTKMSSLAIAQPLTFLSYLKQGGSRLRMRVTDDDR